MPKGISENLENQVFGKLTVKYRHKGTWYCECECGGSKYAATGDLKKGKIKSCGCLYKPRQILTKDFLYNEYIVLGKSTQQIASENNLKQPTVYYNLLKHNINTRNVQEANRKNAITHQKLAIESRWSGHEEISGTYLLKLEQGATQRNIEFQLTKEELWDLFIKQDRKCALSGIEIAFAPKGKCVPQYKELQTASLDRIDSNKPYTIDNVQWVHKNINKMKQDLPQEVFVDLCKLVANNFVPKPMG